MNLEVQICPTVAELMNQSGVKIVNCMTGDEIELVAKEASCLESIQDLREHIARCRKLRATAVTLLANDKTAMGWRSLRSLRDQRRQHDRRLPT